MLLLLPMEVQGGPQSFSCLTLCGLGMGLMVLDSVSFRMGLEECPEARSEPRQCSPWGQPG